MLLTTQEVQKYQGGQAEIQNRDEGYLYRGEIVKIDIENNELRIRFAWLAKGEGFPSFPKRWVKDDHLDYTASLDIYEISNIGPGSEGGDRLCFNSSIVGELTVRNPPDGTKLDPEKIEGLQLVQQRQM